MRAFLSLSSADRYSLHCLEDRIEGGIQQAVDQAGGRVVAAGGLAFVAGGHVKLECGGVGVDLGVQFQERFVDAAQFLGPEVL